MRQLWHGTELFRATENCVPRMMWWVSGGRVNAPTWISEDQSHILWWTSDPIARALNALLASISVETIRGMHARLPVPVFQLPSTNKLPKSTVHGFQFSGSGSVGEVARLVFLVTGMKLSPIRPLSRRADLLAARTQSTRIRIHHEVIWNKEKGILLWIEEQDLSF